MFEIAIQNNGVSYVPVLTDDITVSYERQGTPGKLEFHVLPDEALNFTEGNRVLLRQDDALVFMGYVFSKRRTEEKVIDVTAYDQLRYFKNKDIVTYENLTASEVLRFKICDVYGFLPGEIEDTGWKIENRVEDNVTLFDVMQHAMDETLKNTGNLYVLYDDAGKLTLKNIANMALDLVIEEQTAESYDYESSIDDEVYNQVKLIYENKETGKREIYLVKDSAHINEWGLLQYLEKVDNPANARMQAEAMLTLYNQKARKLSVSGVFGDIRVRGGSRIWVNLNLGDVIVQSRMLVEKVTHKIEGGSHTMDVDLRGGEFIV